MINTARVSIGSFKSDLLGHDDGVAGFQVGSQWSSDGRHVLLANASATLHWDLWIYSVAEKKASLFRKTSFDDVGGVLSPDGKWIVYASD